MKRYITATFYDNDYNSLLCTAVQYIAQRAEHDLSESEFAEWLCDFVAYFGAVQVINRSRRKTFADILRNHKYLSENIKVWFSDSRPEYTDENSEFVMYDTVTKNTWSA